MFDPCGRLLGPGGFPLCDQSYSQSGPPLPVTVATVALPLNTVQAETGLYEKARSIIRSWIHGRELDISGLGLKYIPVDLHPNMKHLNCSKNQLTNLHVLPPKLEHLNCSGNNLTRLPKLPDTLSFLDCRNNPNLIISSVPSSVKHSILTRQKSTKKRNTMFWEREMKRRNMRVTVFVGRERLRQVVTYPRPQ